MAIPTGIRGLLVTNVFDVLNCLRRPADSVVIFDVRLICPMEVHYRPFRVVKGPDATADRVLSDGGTNLFRLSGKLRSLRRVSHVSSASPPSYRSPFSHLHMLRI